MSKIIAAFVLTTVMLATVCVADAQQAKKVPRIGYIVLGDSDSPSARSKTIQRALRELGYIEGQNIVLEYRYAEGKRDRTPEIAAELVRLKVDIIMVAGGITPIRAARMPLRQFPSLCWAFRPTPWRQA
jgi:putative tryptophan/tyrosine transport system substrate-binding protein